MTLNADNRADEGVPNRDAGRGSSALSASDIWRRPLPYLADRGFTRWLLRALLASARPLVAGIEGEAYLRPEVDPCVVALNHSQRTEALIVPATLIFLRGGKMIHFLSDWNFHLYPGLGLALRLAQTITLTNKPARPRFLNYLKPLYASKESGYDRALRCLGEGKAVGVFPEGTVNRDPARLLRGRPGAAQLALRAGCPLVPVGIRFPGHPSDRPIPERIPLVLQVGQPLRPPRPCGEPTREAVGEWHARLMGELARLANKRWEPSNRRRLECHSNA